MTTRPLTEFPQKPGQLQRADKTKNVTLLVEETTSNFFDTEYLKADLKGRSVQGGAITLFAQGCKFVLQAGSIMVLARLLTPGDFGLFAMVIALTNFAMMFKDLGLSPSSRDRNLGEVMSGRGHSGDDEPDETSPAPGEGEPVLETRWPDVGKVQDKVPPGHNKSEPPPGQDRDRIPPGQDKDKIPPGQKDGDKGKGKGKGKGGGKS